MKQRITYLLLSLAATVMITSCFNMFPCTKGSGDIIKEDREMGSFDKIELKTYGNIYLKQGDTHALRIETDDNLIDLVKTEVKNNTLIIYADKNICPEKLRFDIIVKDVKVIKISGSGNIKCINDLKVNDLSIDILGSGEIRIPYIEANNIDIEVTGSGDIAIEGQADRIITEINGSGDVKCLGLIVNEAEVEINGSGDFSIEAVERLFVEINGSGDIMYKGDPIINKEILGSGNIIKK
jgi:hypothetical protein